jgi:hypothetical protein
MAQDVVCDPGCVAQRHLFSGLATYFWSMSQDWVPAPDFPEQGHPFSGLVTRSGMIRQLIS